MSVVVVVLRVARVTAPARRYVGQARVRLSNKVGIPRVQRISQRRSAVAQAVTPTLSATPAHTITQSIAKQAIAPAMAAMVTQVEP